jgi:hypothetical protein
VSHYKTEDELRAHLDIEHKFAGRNVEGGKIKANALLGF